MELIARGIVKARKVILIVAVLLLIPSVFGVIGTYINYNILSYLPEDLDSMIGEQSLEDDFHLAATGMVTVEGLPTADLLQMKEEMEQVPGVSQVFWLSDVLDENVPKEMLPAEIQKFMYGKNNATLMLVRFEESSASATTMNACKELRKLLRKDCFFGGMSMIFEDTKELINSEIPWYVLCAVACDLVVLFLAMESTFIPFIFMLGLLFPIVYNFGTNIFLGQISYITMALAAVLQMGVTMDFSIFLLHRYEEEKLRQPNNEEAMVKAICSTFTSITASSLTTIAGFLALCTMRLTLGSDIGIVMAKGVALGVICTIVILPSMILSADKLLKYRHKVLVPQIKKGSHFVANHALPIVAVFVLLVVPFFWAQSRTDVYYTLFDGLPQDLTGIEGTRRMSEDFNMATQHFILVDDSLTASEITAMTDELEKVDGINQVIALDKYTGPGFPSDLLPSDIKDLLLAGGKKLVIATGAYKNGTDACIEQLAQMIEITKRYDPSSTITGEAALTKDLIEVSAVDIQNVNVASIAAVFLIILISFKSLSIPVILVAAIESAIWINMGIPYFEGSTIAFISSIVIGTIQLGATVDYAILTTSRYTEERSNGYSPKEACQRACQFCSQSILSSGLSFFAACIGVAAISKIDLLKNLCAMISRGAIISMFVIIFVLPALLMLLDWVVAHTTFHWLTKKTQKENA